MHMNYLKLNPLDQGSLSYCPYHPFYVCAITSGMVNRVYGSVSNVTEPVLMGLVAIDHVSLNPYGGPCHLQK